MLQQKLFCSLVQHMITRKQPFDLTNIEYDLINDLL